MNQVNRERLQRAVAIKTLAARLKINEDEAAKIFDESTARLSAEQELRAKAMQVPAKAVQFKTAV